MNFTEKEFSLLKWMIADFIGEGHSLDKEQKQATLNILRNFDFTEEEIQEMDECGGTELFGDGDNAMAKEEFEIRYCKESDITLEEYNKEFVTLPCKCNEEDCEGWVCIYNNKLSIKNHNNIYN